MKSVDDEITVPVLAEELEVTTRKVRTGGIRVNKTAHQRVEVIDQPVIKEEVEVRRVIKDERVDGPMAIRQEGDTTIIPVVKQVITIEKHWVLTEELHVSKRRVQDRSQQSVSLQYEEADVQRIDASGSPTGPAAVTPGRRPAPIRMNKVIK